MADLLSGNLSRRSFIAGGVALGTVGLSSALSACASPNAQPSESGSASSTLQASYLDAPSPITDDRISQTFEADIVVVGLGNAGVIAAITAVEEGASVIALQKADDIHTNGTASSWPKSTVLDEADVKYDAWEIVNELQRGLNMNHGKTELWRNWVNYGEEVANWWISKANVSTEVGPVMTEQVIFGENAGKADSNNKFNEYFLTAHIPLGAAMSGKQGQYVLMSHLFEQALSEGKNIDARFLTPGVQLRVDAQGRVVGVIGQNADGNYHLFTANKGVILATGGYSNNTEMRRDFLPLFDVLPSGQAGNYMTGDGILMGSWANGHIQGFPHCAVVHYDPGIGVPDYNGAVVPWLRVNIIGKRFSNEDMGYALISMQDILQPEATHFQVFDDNYLIDIEDMGQGTQFGDWATMVPTALEKGDLHTGNTIEDLAESMDVPIENLVATVKRYNELAHAGYDKDFGKQASRLKVIEKAPFYAFKRRPAVLATVSGLDVNEDYQVLTSEGEPVAGLYAIGNDSGGMFGGTQYPMNAPGVSVARAMLSGRIAAWRACGKKD